MTSQMLFVSFLIVFMWLINCAAGEGFMTELAQKFEQALRNETIALTARYLQLEIEFYGRVLEKLPPTTKNYRLIEEYRKVLIDFLGEIENGKLATMSSNVLVAKFLDLQDTYISHSLEKFESPTFDSHQFLMDNGLQKLMDDKQTEVEDFYANLRLQWRALYAQIPEDELTKHAAYQEIDRLFHNNPNNFLKMADALQKTIEFLDIKYWDKMEM